MTKTVAIRPILQRLADRSRICQQAVHTTIAAMTEEPIINKTNLRKAVALRGFQNYVIFCQEWLGWPPPLVNYLDKVADRILWGRGSGKRFYHDRQDHVVEVYVAATLAWIKEMNKP